MGDYTQKDFSIQFTESISESVVKALDPLQLISVNQSIKIIGFSSIYDLVYSIYFDADGNFNKNINDSEYVKRISNNHMFVTESIGNVLLKMGVLINKHYIKIITYIGKRDQGFKINSNVQKEILTENYMYKELAKDMELYFKNINHLWELENEKKIDPVKQEKSDSVGGILDWKGSLDELNKLSKELKAKGFTKNPTDFEKVFTEQLPTEWLKEPEYLAYLLEKLYTHKVPQFSATKGGKFKIAQTLFYENVENSRNYFNLSDLIYNVISRQAVKHYQLRKKVDKLIAYFIK